MNYNELIEEKRALDNNIRALHAFVASDRWLMLSESEHELVQAQFIPMGEYSKILGRRIQAMEYRPEGEAVEVHTLPESKAAE